MVKKFQEWSPKFLIFDSFVEVFLKKEHQNPLLCSHLLKNTEWERQSLTTTGNLSHIWES
jgi:hypothetical protein